MNYDKPFYRRSPAAIFSRYSTRLLVGLLGSLGVVGLLLNLPLFYSSPQVGWTAQRPAEPIALRELPSEHDESEDAEPEPAEKTTETPPPTRHAPPTPDGSAGTDDNATDDEPSRKRVESPESSSSPKMVAALTTQDRHPQIKGGSGALYLQIHYPEAARQQGIEGRLKLEFTVGREGQVHAIEVAKSLHPLCDSAAVRALRSVEFRPAIHKGNPIPVRMTLPIRFQLQPDRDNPLHTRRRSPSS